MKIARTRCGWQATISFDDFATVVDGTIVQNYQIQIGIGLVEDRVDTLFEKWRVIVVRNNDRHAWSIFDQRQAAAERQRLPVLPLAMENPVKERVDVRPRQVRRMREIIACRKIL